MAYNPDIPQSFHDPSQSQGQILDNFQELNTFLSVNHVPFDGSDPGKHKFLQLPEESSAPTTLANEGALYTKEESGSTQLFFREESDGSEVQLTNSFNASSIGSITFPGGLVMNWGILDVPSGGATATFDTAFTSSVFSVVATSFNTQSNSNATVENVTLTTAKFFSSEFNAVYYLAVGV